MRCLRYLRYVPQDSHAPFFEVLVLHGDVLDLFDFFGHLRVEDSVVGLLLGLVQDVENACPQQASVCTNVHLFYISTYTYMYIHIYISTYTYMYIHK
jgi:hypothetical protein